MDNDPSDRLLYQQKDPHVESLDSLTNRQTTASSHTCMVPYQPPTTTESIASVSVNMTRPELSCSSIAITTTISHSKVVQKSTTSTATPTLPTQTISVKKMWEERQKISLSRERRATRILGIVMGVFVACW